MRPEIHNIYCTYKLINHDGVALEITHNRLVIYPLMTSTRHYIYGSSLG